MSDLVDASVFCGYWPFRHLRQRTPAALKRHLQERGVCQAWVASAEAVLYPDPMQGNEPLFKEIAGDDFFVAVATVNPTLATWMRDAVACIDRWGCHALKLAPNYHSIALSDPRVADVVDFAQDAGLPVCMQLRMMDERSHHPLMKVPGVPAEALAALACEHPKARFLACAAYRTDLSVLGRAPNIWAEISMVESGQTLRDALDLIDARRLVFGSHSPFLYFEAVAAKLDVNPVDVDHAVVRAIRDSNARELLTGE